MGITIFASGKLDRTGDIPQVIDELRKGALPAHTNAVIKGIDISGVDVQDRKLLLTSSRRH